MKLFLAILGTGMFFSMLIFLGMMLTSILSDKRHNAKEKLYAPYHEAGHVVLAMVTGMGFDKVSIETNAHNLGFMSHRSHQYAIDRQENPENFFALDNRQRLENALMTSLAGYVVEILMCGKTKFPTHTLPYGDMEAIYEILMNNPFLYEELSLGMEEYLESLKEATRNVIIEYAKVHNLIAEELKVREVLSELEVWELVKNNGMLSSLDNPYSPEGSLSSAS